MLREVKNARFGRRAGLFGARYFLDAGAEPGAVSWRRRAFLAIQAEQELRPVALLHDGARTYWLFEQRVY
jgi:hypothetical protein